MLIVTCDNPEYLVKSLPDAGLGGELLGDGKVLVNDLGGSDPSDVAFELNEYGDRFGISGIDLADDLGQPEHDHDPGGCTCGCPVPGCEGCSAADPNPAGSGSDHA